MRKLLAVFAVVALVGLGVGGALLWAAWSGQLDHTRYGVLFVKIRETVGVASGVESRGCPKLEGVAVEGPRPAPAPTAAVVKVPERFDACPSHALSLDVPLRVRPSAAAALASPALTTAPLPLPRALGLRSLNALVVRDASGAVLPAQLEVLSRWGAGPGDCAAPIRHALVHVRAVPPPAASLEWRVQLDASAAATTPSIKLERGADGGFVVDTGAARFAFGPKGPIGGFGVSLAGGRAVVDGEKMEGFKVRLEGAELSPGKPWRVEAERSGPELVTLVARGFYEAPGKPRALGYTARATLVGGEAMLQLDHTVYHHAVLGPQATDLARTATLERVWLDVPLVGDVERVAVRAAREVHTPGPREPTRLAQKKRTASAPMPRFAIVGPAAEEGAWAERPFLGASTSEVSAVATIAHLAPRDPQALAWDGTRTISLEPVAEPLAVGGARGLWTRLAIHFGPAADPAALAARADALQVGLERPRQAAPAVAAINASRSLGPYAPEDGGRYVELFELMGKLHANTVDFLRAQRVTGLQLWPDLPDVACTSNDTCVAGELGDFADNHYWNWSKPAYDEFLRTARGDLLHDFALGEARTFVETTAVRPAHDALSASSVAGLAPCHGSSRGFGDTWREGLNQRVDHCPGDFTYNKHLAYAYLVTGDRRFVDFFEEAGLAALDALGETPTIQSIEFLEVSLGRLGEQRLEQVLNGAEFARDPKAGARIRAALLRYVELLLDEQLVGGHLCDVTGSGVNSACALKFCESPQAWMLPTVYAALRRAGGWLSHPRLEAWAVAYGATAARRFTVTDTRELPDPSKREASSKVDAANGWRTVYDCEANPKQGVVESTCKKRTDIEAEGTFYDNGWLAFLNLFGQVLGADARDPNRVCEWLPDAYLAAVRATPPGELNGLVWGKASGQALAFAAEAAGALSGCAGGTEVPSPALVVPPDVFEAPEEGEGEAPADDGEAPPEEADAPAEDGDPPSEEGAE